MMRIQMFIERNFPNARENVLKAGEKGVNVYDTLMEKPDDYMKRVYVNGYRKDVIIYVAFGMFWILD